MPRPDILNIVSAFLEKYWNAIIIYVYVYMCVYSLQSFVAIGTPGLSGFRGGGKLYQVTDTGVTLSTAPLNYFTQGTEINDRYESKCLCECVSVCLCMWVCVSVSVWVSVYVSVWVWVWVSVCVWVFECEWVCVWCTACTTQLFSMTLWCVVQRVFDQYRKFTFSGDSCSFVCVCKLHCTIV